MYSLRRRLTLAIAIGFSIVIIGASVCVSAVISERVTAEFDAALVARVRTFVALTEQESGHIELDYVPELMPEFEREERPEYFEFWLDDGTPLLRSTRLDGDLPREAGLANVPLVRDARLPDGRPGRVVQLAWVPKGPDRPDDPEEAIDPATLSEDLGKRAVVLVVGRDRQPLDSLLAGMHVAILGGGGAAIALALLLVWRTLITGFRPIEAIAARVGQLDAESLGTRVAPRRAPAELAPVIEQLNGLLARLEASFERERRFAGNVAHELRTPIAELRSLAKVGAKWPDDEASVAMFFQDVGDVATRMESVITDLLLLARCQAGVEHVARAPTSLRQVTAACWSELSPCAFAKGIRLRLVMREDLVVDTDPGKMAMIVANVLRNAVSYAPAGSQVVCTGAKIGSRCRLEITNAAERLRPADLANLCEPFWRKDDSRSSPEHAGLGLALVMALAQLLDLRVRFDQDRSGTFRVRIEGRACDDRILSQGLSKLG